MVQDTVNELTIRGKAGVIDIIDVMAGDRVPFLVSTLAASPRFIVAAVREQLMADIAVTRHPSPTCRHRRGSSS